MKSVWRMPVVLSSMAAFLLACGVVAWAQTPPGPCCPRIQGLGPFAGDASQPYVGPRYLCSGTTKLALVYDGLSADTQGVNAAGTLLVPVRAFTITGAEIETPDRRTVIVNTPSRSVTLTLGSHDVTVMVGGQAVAMVFSMCPRLRNGVTFVPARAMAGALGMSVDWEPGKLTLLSGAAAAEVQSAAAGVPCPVDQLGDALGIAAVPGQVETPFGLGVGVVSVVPDGRADALGLQPKDVILACDGNRVTCPKDLHAIMATKRAAGAPPCTLTISRDGKKLDLKCAAHQ